MAPNTVCPGEETCTLNENAHLPLVGWRVLEVSVDSRPRLVLFFLLSYFVGETTYLIVIFSCGMFIFSNFKGDICTL